MSTTPIRIILVDDHKLSRQSWSMLLGYDKRFTIIQECDNGSDAIEAARNLVPDIILIDINMSPINGFEASQKILETHPDMKIIGISVNNQPSYAYRLLDIGARGFVTKGSPFDEITHAILEVQKGEKYICAEIRNMIPD